MITSIWMKPGDDLKTALDIREQVFQQELGFTKEADQDALDAYSYHLVLLLNDVPVATGRISYDGVGMARLSRICVRKKYRRQGIGDGLVKVLDYKASQLGMGHSRVETVPELEPWSPLLSVSSRRYMQGYQKLEGPGVKPIHRLLAKIADGPLHLQIVRAEFREGP